MYSLENVKQISIDFAIWVGKNYGLVEVNQLTRIYSPIEFSRWNVERYTIDQLFDMYWLTVV